nr:Arc family DNA-binding protein [Nitrincola tibetensis]
MLTVRNLPDEVHKALRIRAAYNGRSMEAEVRQILQMATENLIVKAELDIPQQSELSDNKLQS